MTFEHLVKTNIISGVPTLALVFVCICGSVCAQAGKGQCSQFAEGKSLPYPLKHFHSSQAFPSLPDSNSKLTRLSDLVILKLRPARLFT